MKKRLAMLLALSLCLSGNPVMTAAAATETGSVTMVKTNTLSEEFANPPAEAKIRSRYWLPAACVEEKTLREDLEELAELNIGGIEVVSYDTMTSGIPDSDAWGTEKWDEAMTIITDECDKLGLEVSMTNGPAWPVAMPSIQSADDEAALYEMTYGETDIAGGETYHDVVPVRNTVHDEGTTHLMTVAAYKLTGEKTLDYSSYIDLTSYVDVNEEDESQSTLNWEAPEGDTWAVFSFWEQPACQKTSGYYVIDHFGKAGAQAAIDYWEQVIADKDYMKNVTDIFEDSLEYDVDKEWTRGFEDIFKTQKGYDLMSYLPVIGGTGYYQTDEGPDYSFTDAELTTQIKNDYNDVVTYCYEENHLKPMQEMAEKYGMNLRAQVAYNKPMDTVSSALYVGTPETEGLNRNTIDFYRQMAAAVHMTGKNILSMETAAEFDGDYSQNYEDLGTWLKRAWAGGVTREVLHGSSYSGNVDEEEETTMGNSYIWGGNAWPGWRAFGGYISNDWNRNVSDEMSGDYMLYFARMNYIMQKQSKIDAAVYYDTYTDDFVNEDYTTGGDGTDRYPDNGALNAAGYSYEFVSTDILNLDTATVTNGCLNEEGPAYKVLILHNQTTISLSALERIYTLAKAGLPVVFVGETPSQIKYYSEVLSGNTDTQITNLVNEMLKLDIVISVNDYADVPSALNTLGIKADASYAKSTDILSRHTTDENGEYYYLYNYNKVSAKDASSQSALEGTAVPSLDKNSLTEKKVTVTLQGQGTPYEMDPWNGTITPISDYKVNEGSITLAVDIDKNDAKVIAILNDAAIEENGLIKAALHNSVLTVSTAMVDGHLVVKSTNAEDVTIKLNNGDVVTAAAEDIQPAFSIDTWNLKIDSIEPGETNYFRDSQWNTIDVGDITELKGWKDLDESFTYVSGLGTYSSTFTLDAGWEDGCGAYLNLGEVEDIYKVTINGTELPMTNQISTKIDIGPYVKAGENTVVVKVASTLYNKAQETGGTLTSSSMIVMWLGIHLHDSYANGLLGTDGVVTVQPYKMLNVEESEAYRQAAELRAEIQMLKAQIKALRYAAFKSIIRSVKALSGRKITIRVKKISGSTKYQVKYSYYKNFSNSKTKTSSSGTITLKNLKAGKTVYLMTRALCKISGKTVCSKFSNVKKVTVK